MHVKVTGYVTSFAIFDGKHIHIHLTSYVMCACARALDHNTVPVITTFSIKENS